MNALTLQTIVTEELGTARIGVVGKTKGDSKLRRIVWSRRLPGFGTRYYASGRTIYMVQAAMQGRTRTVTIGNAKILSEAQAMDVARRVLLRAQVGQNPAERRKKRRKVPLFTDFLDNYWRKVSPSWKTSTLHTHGLYRQNYLQSAFTGMFLDEIEQSHVQEWFNRVTEVGGPGAANRSCEILRAMFNKAEEWGVKPEGSNPCSSIRMNRRRKCERFLSDQEFRRLGAAIDKHRRSRPVHCAALQLLILTGCRRSEITGLTWSEVKSRRLLLTDSKTGPRTVWLGEAAWTIIKCLPRHKRRPEVFFNPKTGRKVDIDCLWKDVREEAGLHGVRLHDLRHSFASHAAARSETLPMIGKLLGHRHVTTTARYAHLDDGPVIEAGQRIGDLIEEMMGSNRSLNHHTMCDRSALLYD
ncbi:site-specific integrase [Erythrobacter sp.]|uniref:tyrosine-type recombinase/integrase n=1 Tax=Erythrobacter sp. TaxID=1042 RepID=UPI001425C023|nr:site-specific integrase [Erythrobacter sp.]QIQ86457.1 MAG: site-specific integrase [Erythrobacter sp.]